MKFTDRELELSRRLHDLGERPEIREGDWIINKLRKGECELIFPNDSALDTDQPSHYLNLKKERPRVVFLWTWERCREWLSERGWSMAIHYDVKEGEAERVIVDFYRLSANWPMKKRFSGATDLEAILSVCVAVAEEE